MKGGKKIDDFLIDKSPRKVRRKRRSKRLTSLQRCVSPYGLLDELGTKTGKFRVRDWSGLLQTVELLYLISGAVTNDSSKLVARLLSLLDISLGHPVALRDHVHKHGKEWNYD